MTRPSTVACRVGLAALIGLVVVVTDVAHAQTNADVSAGLQFSFIPPGARSLALGGAFTGLADDATAAWTNPAGLLNLSRSEVSLEFRDATYTNEYISGGSYRPNASGVGLGSSESSVSSPSFASFVAPARSGRWSGAIFYHQLSDFSARQLSAPVTGDDPNDPDDSIPARDGRYDLEIPGFGVSGALRFTERFTLGASLVYYDYSLDSVTSTPNASAPPGFVSDRQVMSGSDTDLSGIVGMQWSGDATRVSLVYRRSPAFDTDYRFVCGTPGGGSQLCNNLPAGSSPAGLSGTSTLRVPDSAALGIAWSVTDQLLIAADVNQVFYSQLSDEIANIQTVGRGDPNYADQFEIDDATELHLGAELAIPFGQERSFFVRVGGWLDPDHRLRFTPDNATEANNYEKVIVRFNSVEEQDEVHITGGLGVTLGSSFQLDVGADFSDLVDLVSISGVFRF